MLGRGFMLMSYFLLPPVQAVTCELWPQHRCEIAD